MKNEAVSDLLPCSCKLKKGKPFVLFLIRFSYLNDLNDDQGGSTSFPHLNLSVTPKKNRAAFWFNINANGGESDETLHSGDPVKYGQKWGLNVWICEHETD